MPDEAVTANGAIQIEFTRYRHCKEWGGERSEPVTPPRSPIGEVHMQMYIEGMRADEAEGVILISDQTSCWRRARRCVRLAEWVPPVGGALIRHISTWDVQATGVHRRGRVAALTKQPRRCQKAEETRGPPTGRAYRGGGGKKYPLRRLRLALAVWGFTGSRAFALGRYILYTRSLNESER
jgi:hypothetical protein